MHACYVFCAVSILQYILTALPKGQQRQSFGQSTSFVRSEISTTISWTDVKLDGRVLRRTKPADFRVPLSVHPQEVSALQ